MRFNPGRALLWGAVAVILAFLFVPVAIIILYAFSASNIQGWPIQAFSLKWFAATLADGEVRSALWLSIEVAVVATALAMLMGLLAALAVHRLRGPASEAIAFAVVLPIALPGILTGMALNSYFVLWGINLSFWTIIVGHATFCTVIVYNNVIARLRRLPTSWAEASADLGAGPWRTFRLVTLPMIGSALGAGALLAFALSFDEVIVTTFTAGAQTTLPLWIFGAIRLGQHLPEVNVVVFVVIALTIVPVLLAQRLMGRAALLHK
ncbi:MAG TPA: ABC transporter permease [Acidisoma sp.]|jgi:putative spermidine/putrescine transport system permease protein|nr:ABC transporter permease [Acidisoma sp.]